MTRCLSISPSSLPEFELSTSVIIELRANDAKFVAKALD